MKAFTTALRLFWRDPLGFLVVVFSQLTLDQEGAQSRLKIMFEDNPDLAPHQSTDSKG